MREVMRGKPVLRPVSQLVGEYSVYVQSSFRDAIKGLAYEAICDSITGSGRPIANALRKYLMKRKRVKRYVRRARLRRPFRSAPLTLTQS